MRWLLLIGIYLFFQSIGVSQCATADFDVSAKVGCIPMSVKCTASGYPTGATFSWNFGGGFSSFSSSDSVKSTVYISAGSYAISLKVKDASGNICTINKPSLISVSGATTVSFKIVTSKICSIGDTALIVNSTSGITGMQWLTDGTKINSSGDTLRYVYQTPGYKSIGLTVTNSSGCIYSKTTDSAIRVYDGLFPSFTAKQTTFCPPYTDSFFSTTAHPGVSISKYTWLLSGTFADSTSDSIAAYRFTDTGTFNLTLKILTDYGCPYQNTRTGYLKSFQIIQPQLLLSKNLICNNDTLVLTNNTPPGNGTGNYSLNLFGGNNANKGSIGTGAVKVTYTKAGKYPLKISFKSSNCAADSLYDSIVVVSQIGTKIKSDSSIFCNDADTVHFTDSSWSKPGVITTKLWKVQLNKKTIDSSYISNPAYFFNVKGKYAVSLTIQESNGCMFQTSKNIIIDTPTAKAAFLPPNACVGDTVYLRDLTNAYTSFPPYKIWKILASDFSTIIYSDTNTSPYYKFSNPGQYYLSLYTSNRLGCSDSTIDSVGISVGAPSIAFHIIKDTVCAGATVILKRDSLPIFPSITYRWTASHRDSSGIIYTATGDSVGITPKVPGYYHLKVLAAGSFCADSVWRDSVIAVNGISATYQTDSASACIPVSIRSRAVVLQNTHLNQSSNDCIYAWSSSPSGPLFSGPDSVSTNITFTSGGCYNINCEVTNSSGCKSTITGAFNGCIGQVAGFSTTKSTYCLGDTIYISNKSKKNTGYKWFIKNSLSLPIFPSDTATTPYFIASKEGKYNLGLIAFTSYGCPDTTYQTIQVNRPVTTVYSPDSVSLCGPTTVEFNTNSPGGAYFDWDFGDGSPVFSTTQTTIYHIYQIQQGKSTFDLQLTTRDKAGCTYKLSLPGFITILGPAPYFKMQQTGGCDSLQVDFSNASKYVYKYFFFDGLGNNDTSIPARKVYHITSSAANYETVMPYMVGFDSTGKCAIVYQPSDSLYIYNHPQAIIYADKKRICEGQEVQFSSGGSPDTARYWYFNGILSDSLTQFKRTFKLPGNYQISLVVTNRFGCKDSASITGGIIVKSGPKAGFEADDTLHCLEDTVTFSDKSIIGAGLISYAWKFYDPSQPDTFSGHPAQFKFSGPGVYPVSYWVKDSLGCTDSIYKPDYIHISNQNYAIKTGLRFLDMQDDSTLEIVWEKNPSPFFKEYLIMLDSFGMKKYIYKSTVAQDTVLRYPIQLTGSGRNLSFGALSHELCSQKAIPDSFHKYIYLEADTFGLAGIKIHWNSYQGWGLNKGLSIQKFANTLPTITLNRRSDDTTYFDEPLCDSLYSYRIVMSNGKYVSHSNKVSLFSGYKTSSRANDIHSVSVAGNYIEIKFDTLGDDTFQHHFKLVRSEAGKNDQTISPIWNSPAEDKNISEGKTYYIYTIHRTDYCGKESPGGLSGNNIILQSTTDGDTIRLFWNKYAYWTKGVQKYVIYQLDPQTGLWEAMDQTWDTCYAVRQLPDLVSASFCFKVAAIGKDRSREDTSISNIACSSMPAKVFVPSAFSPNGDTHNELFKPTATFIYNLQDRASMAYSFDIYNRWGSKVFHTNNPEAGWDGSNEGKPCEAGIYFYRVQASPFTGYQKINLDGQFMLLR